MVSKPMGIVILAILQLLSALFYLATGVLLLLPLLATPLAILGAWFALIFTIVGIIGLILFYGLWTLKSWAWLWTLIINILGILGALGNIMGNIIGLAISLIIVIYLLMPDIRSKFR